MPSPDIDRRRFLRTAAGAGALTAGLVAGCEPKDQQPADAEDIDQPTLDRVGPRLDYQGPNVILIRFGGGVRRLETILDPEHTYCPFVYHELIGKQGILFPNVDMEYKPGTVVTSHGQGTLYILTGKFDHYEDISRKPFADRFEPKVPTVFEYLRRHYEIPAHQALIINGEDRIDEEFYTFSNHHQYGIRYRSTVLSLYRFKTFLLREELAGEDLSDKDRDAKEKQLHDMVSKDYRVQDITVVSPKLDEFWRDWRGYYGKSGLVNPRGDRLLTELALRAMKQLRPRMMMINYQDPDYVHWGNPHFYTRAISTIDDGIRQIYQAAQADEEYRDNTVFLIIPDCGRDSNRCMAVPFQHHFGAKSAYQLFAVAAGRDARGKVKIDHPGRPVDKSYPQISMASTVANIMGFPADHVDHGASSFEEMLA
jgi:hypothetical protein